MTTPPEAFLHALAPYRQRLVVAVAWLFPWDWLADRGADAGRPFVLGHALSLPARRYKKYLPYYHLKAHITKLKQRPKYRWWSQLGSQAIQNIVERIDKGYQRFFQHVRDRQAGKTTQRVGPPTFRKVCNANSLARLRRRRGLCPLHPDTSGLEAPGREPLAHWHHGLQVRQVQSHRRHH
jgi:hypothetical protein